MKDNDMLLRIQELLDGVEWNSDTLELIADLLNNNGYRIRDIDDKDRDVSDTGSLDYIGGRR